MPSSLRIELFGELRAIHGERTTSRFQTQKTAVLLAYLTTFSSRAHTRESLADMIWGEDTPAARHKLRMALSSLRQEFRSHSNSADPFILADRLTVTIDAHAITSDVSEFKSLIATGSAADSEADRIIALESAVSLYRGPFLRDFYEDWIPPVRREFEESCLGVLRRLVRSLAPKREFDRATQYARQAVAIDPLREEAHRDLMRLLAATGQPSAALRQYRELEEMLHDELGVRPSQATKSLASELISIGSKGPRVAAERPSGVSAARLPGSPTQFFGRVEELALIGRLLNPSEPDTGSRLVTLTGMGGSGKTRLALEVARKLIKAFDGRIWFVSLADITDRSSVPAAIAQALGLALPARSDPLDTIAGVLAVRRTMLVLDNYEHLARDGAQIAADLLDKCDSLSLLVTSRCPLGLTVEHEIGVGSLPYHVGSDQDSRTRAEPSLEMLIDRIKTIRPDFALTPRNRPVALSICEALEGIPLSIELAASRARVLSLEEIAEQLTRPLDFLTDRVGASPLRHQSLRNAIRWSYHLLPPDARILLPKLSVFRGGFTAASVASVCLLDSASQETTESRLGSLQVHSMLEDLCESSLLTAEETNGTMRFRMFEVIREFAAEEMPAESSLCVRRRHANYFMDQLGDAGAVDRAPIGPEAMQFMVQEHPNLLAALEWASEHHPDRALMFAVQLARYWWLIGDLDEGRARLCRTIKRASSKGSEALLAEAFRSAGRIAVLQGDEAAALSDYEQSITLFSRIGDPKGVATVDRALGVIEYSRGNRDSALQRYTRSLAEFRRLNHLDGIAATLNDLGLFSYDSGDCDGARELFEESEALWRKLGYPERATALSNLGMVARAQGRYSDARAHYEEHLAIRSSEGNMAAVAHGWHNLAALAFDEGNPKQAVALYLKALSAFQKSGSFSFVADSLDGCVASMSSLGDLHHAARFLGASDAMREKTGIIRREPERSSCDRARSDARSILGDAEFYELYLAGRSQPLDEQVESACLKSLDAD